MQSLTKMAYPYRSLYCMEPIPTESNQIEIDETFWIERFASHQINRSWSLEHSHCTNPAQNGIFISMVTLKFGKDDPQDMRLNLESL